MGLYRLRNGVELPPIAVGTNRMNFEKLKNIISAALNSGISFFDSARDYGNEAVVGDALNTILKELGLSRDKVQIATKVGNSQQATLDMSHEIDLSLKNLKTDYVDVWFLHWPYPDYYITNMRQMYSIVKSGKVRAIGLANPRVRHLKVLYEETGIIPHVIQIEHHPFRLSQELLDYCSKNNIQVEAYSPLCYMIDKIKTNTLLCHLARKYNKSLGQIVLRWHYQHGVIPVFRSEKTGRFKENSDIFDFKISNEDINLINNLDEDYKFIPESLHCPGY